MSAPLAYFLTFTAYGSRLHGDERGTVDDLHRTWGEDYAPVSPGRVAFLRRQLAGDVMVFGERERVAIERGIRDACVRRRWMLHALNVRTNHVHVVLSAAEAPEAVLGALKAWASRRMREAKLIERGARVWTDHGSTRYLWNETAVADACTYTMESQGPALPGAASPP